MMRLQVCAPGKVNLGLFLGPTRAGDGRHELVTVFESVSLADLVTAEIAAGGADQVFCDGIDGPNLAAAALAALRARGWDGPPLRVTIEKRVPVAGGMAGGSADAAAVLRLVAAQTPPHAGPSPGGAPTSGPCGAVTPEALAEIARELGADVPAQLAPGRWLGTGAGELLEPVRPPAEHHFVIVPLAFELSTPAVFREADRLGLGRTSAELKTLAGMIRRHREHALIDDRLLVNDLQPAALSLRPEIGEALAALSDAGADHAFVSGSGPTVAGLFWGAEAAEQAADAAARLAAAYALTTTARPVDGDFTRPVPA